MNDYKNKEQWVSMLNNAQMTFFYSVNDSPKSLDQIACALSEDHINKIADELNRENRSLSCDVFLQIVKPYFIESGISEDESDYLSRSLYLSLLLYIKEVKPEVFKDISDKDFQAAVLEQQNRINELLKIITNFVLSIEKTGIFSLDELNEELLSTTRNPSIGIDFFVTDDDSFHKELEKCLYNEFIIEDSKKHYYFRGLSNWRTEQGWLRDTCLDGQDTFIRLLNQLGIPRE